MNSQKMTVKLKGVPETLLWPLYNRASEARKKNAMLQDPAALRIFDSIEYPYEKHFGLPDQYHILRALRFDEQIRLFLREHPDATIVALGDGLETQFLRVDNGQLKWLAVDLQESIDLRRQFIPDSDRHRNLVCSAINLAWVKEVDRSRGVLVTAQGLMMYFEPEQVKQLIGSCAESFPNGWMLFDTIPRSFSESTLHQKWKTPEYCLPSMPWGINADELPSIQAFHRNIVEVAEVATGRGRGWVYGVEIPLRRMLGRLHPVRTCFVRVRFGNDQVDQVRNSKH